MVQIGGGPDIGTGAFVAEVECRGCLHGEQALVPLHAAGIDRGALFWGMVARGLRDAYARLRGRCRCDHG